MMIGITSLICSCSTWSITESNKFVYTFDRSEATLGGFLISYLKMFFQSFFYFLSFKWAISIVLI